MYSIGSFFVYVCITRMLIECNPATQMRTQVYSAQNHRRKNDYLLNEQECARNKCECELRSWLVSSANANTRSRVYTVEQHTPPLHRYMFICCCCLWCCWSPYHHDPHRPTLRECQYTFTYISGERKQNFWPRLLNWIINRADMESAGLAFSTVCAVFNFSLCAPWCVALIVLSLCCLQLTI